MTIELTTLSNGLRVLTDPVDSVGSVAIGIWADVGTRHEDLQHNGVAHMVEHMMFKGTPTRNAAQIVEQIEDVGGHINAYTSREVTAYHIHLLKDDLPLGMEILADIMQHPAMPEDEIAQERDVIIQEIGMTNDTPDDLVFDNYQETAYPGQALGAPILGSAEIVGNMTRETMMDYVHRFYTPGRLVVSASGNLCRDDLVQQVSDLFGDLPEDHDDRYPVADYQGGENRLERDLEQSHLVLGFQGVSRHDENYYAAVALSTVLGGGMSSRLFQEIREKRGLVYSIFSFNSAFQDDGQMAIYAGTGPDRLEELTSVLCDEIRKISTDVVSDEELKRAKTQLKANLLMSRESMMSRANQQAKELIHFDKILDIDEKLDKIAAVTKDDVRNIAGRIFTTRPTLAALGPIKNLPSYDEIERRLAA